MTLSDEAGCAGADNLGALAPICHACSRRQHHGGQYITPPARLIGGEWVCEERRHEPDLGAVDNPGKPLAVGETVGGCACAGERSGAT